jgi:hypothetical protein
MDAKTDEALGCPIGAANHGSLTPRSNEPRLVA